MDAILNNSFSWILFIASIVTCVAFIYDYKKSRPARLEKLAEQMKKTDNTLSKKEKKEILEPHGVAGQLGSLFFIVLIVFIFRSFIIEPFRIPSGSMYQLFKTVILSLFLSGTMVLEIRLQITF